MLEYDFQQSVGYWIIVASRAFDRALNAEVSHRGITWRQCQLLGCLAMRGEATQSELAMLMSVEAPTLVGILDRMQRDGWIVREDCEHDRRKKVVRPTEKAEPIWQEIKQSALKVRKKMTAGLSEEQVASLRDMLALVEKNLKDMVPSSESSGMYD